MNPHTQNAPGITGLILAGGRGSRMGGVDKGLQNFRGLPLALQTLMRLQLQSLPPQEILINANRNLAAYESFGVPVWPDAASLGDFAGPLAGFLVGLERAETPYLVTIPCDCPGFPLDLVQASPFKASALQRLRPLPPASVWLVQEQVSLVPSLRSQPSAEIRLKSEQTSPPQGGLFYARSHQV